MDVDPPARNASSLAKCMARPTVDTTLRVGRGNFRVLCREIRLTGMHDAYGAHVFRNTCDGIGPGHHN
eukprot:8694284-Prorocentrum_lima.AAC.1